MGTRRRRNVDRSSKDPAERRNGLGKAARVSAEADDVIPKPLRRRKAPRQSRAVATVEAILEAATELFASEGYARATTNRIARRAGVSIGTLYQYFPGKDAILAALLDRHRRAVHDLLSRSLEEIENPSIPIETGLRNLLSRLVAVHEADPRLSRALSQEVASPVLARSGVDRGKSALFERLERALAHRGDVRPGADPRLMARILGQALEALSRWLVHDAPPDLAREAAIEEILRLLSLYVRP